MGNPHQRGELVGILRTVRVRFLELVQEQTGQRLVSNSLALAAIVIDHQFRHHFRNFFSDESVLLRSLPVFVGFPVFEAHWFQPQ